MFRLHQAPQPVIDTLNGSGDFVSLADIDLNSRCPILEQVIEQMERRELSGYGGVSTRVSI